MADNFIPQDGAFTFSHNPDGGVRQYAASAEHWTPSPRSAWAPLPNLQSSDPHDFPEYVDVDDLADSHVDSLDDETDNIHHDEGPFARALDCPEQTCDTEVCADDDEESPDPHNTPYDQLEPDFDDDSDDDTSEPPENIVASRGIATVPNYRFPQGVATPRLPFATRAGAVRYTFSD
jgi:hypothetical protein